MFPTEVRNSLTKMIPEEILNKIRRIDIRTRHMVNDVLGGQYESVFKGQGMEFEEVREYYPGDEYDQLIGT